jgi:hypothetical protein
LNRAFFGELQNPQYGVTAVTAFKATIGENVIVIIGSVARKKAIFEPGDNEAAEERGSRCKLR